MRRFIFPALLAVAALGLLSAPPHADAYRHAGMYPYASMPPMPPMPPMPQMPPMPYYSAPQMPYGQYPMSGYQMRTYPAQGYQTPGNPYEATAEPSYEAVALYDNLFDPDSIAVPVGTAVVWKNYGRHHHTVTSDDGTWGSGELETGGTYSCTFRVPGTYHYYCRVHAREMRGTIVVQ
jgi:plastocyanin